MSGGRAFVDITMSLDGFITGPNDSVESPLGEGGDRLHRWVYDLASFRRPHGLEGGETGGDDDLLKESFERTGAVVMGKRMFDHGEEPWGDDPPFHNPVFVLTHRARDPLVKQGGTTFTFVTDGIERALEQAKAGAGGRRRLFEDLGTEQIELEGTRVIDSQDVTHLQFRPPRKEGGTS